MGSKQNEKLLSALAEALEKSRQNRSETVSALSALRSHLNETTHCRASSALPLKQKLSPRETEDSYNELLISKYREKCKKMHEELCDTRARLSASENRVQDLEVHRRLLVFTVSLSSQK
jgi:hypothetical protein